ncbi:MAG: hypothetical protein ACR2QM_04495 [Longimicrobiales bacterium]
MAPLLALVVLVLAGGFFWWIYYRREFAVGSRPLLLGARLLTLLGLILLLWNPALPWGSGAATPRFVLLDASASMSAAADGGTTGGTLWDAAVSRAQELAADGYRVLLTGSQVIPTDAAGLSQLTPEGTSSTASEALSVAVEAGAREVVLLSDLRLEDPLAAAALAERGQIRIEVDSLPIAASNVGLARVILPASVEGGESVQGRAEVQGDSPDDSLSLALSVDGSPALTLRVAAPKGGGISAVDFELPSALGAGSHVVELALEGQDAFPGDDRRLRILRVDPEETGVLLVSFVPDWEARFLFPVLAQVTGLPARGYIQVGPERYMALDGGPQGEVDEAGLIRLMARAELVVALGVNASNMTLVERGVRRARRLLLFPDDQAGASLGGFEVGPPVGGEWYVDEPPASPIAGSLGDFPLTGLPPLTRVLPLTDNTEGNALGIRLGGAGRPGSAVALRSDGRRRVAAALARGFWRWAFRDGEPRDRYRRLWSAVGGWMLADEPLAAGPGVRPVDPVLPRGLPMMWQGRGFEGDSVQLTISDAQAAVQTDTLLAIPGAGLFEGPGLAPGRYDFTAVLEADTTGGTFVVEDFTDDMLHRALDPSILSAGGGAGTGPTGGTRPLRTSPLPYLFILATLCGEWIGRRRAGLR